MASLQAKIWTRTFQIQGRSDNHSNLMFSFYVDEKVFLINKEKVYN